MSVVEAKMNLRNGNAGNFYCVLYCSRFAKLAKSEVFYFLTHIRCITLMRTLLIRSIYAARLRTLTCLFFVFIYDKEAITWASTPVKQFNAETL